MRLRCFLLAMMLLSGQSLRSQETGVSSSDIDTITSILNITMPYHCLTEEMVNVDLAIKPLNDETGGFEDPYGTLKDCYVFTYYRDSVELNEPRPKLSVGVYKEGTIIARLDTAIETEYSSSGRIKAITDLNHDGKVDIIITRTLGVSPPPWEEYWIVSWDGHQLDLISGVNRKEHKSALQSPWNFIRFEDIDHDGIMELVTTYKDEKGIDKEHVYSWNGKLYGEWGNGSKELMKALNQKKK